MAVERIDSIMDIPAINAEFSALKAGLVDSQKGLTQLYDLIKSFKDTTLSNLATNSEKLSQAITGAVTSTAKAAQSYDQLTQKIAAQTAAVRDGIVAAAGQSAAYDQLIRQAVRNKLAQQELAQSAKEVKAAFDKGETTFEQYTASLESIRAAQQTLKISGADITKSLNNLEKQAQASASSVDGLQAKINLLRQAYDKLSEEERGTEEGQGLVKNIQETDAALQKLKNDTGRFQDNVGNYKGAFREAFEVLRNELQQVNKELGGLEQKGQTTIKNLTGGGTLGFDPNRYKGQVSSFTKAGGEVGYVAAGDEGKVQQLTKRQELLNKLVTNTGMGFKSTRQEMRAFQEAAVELGLSLGQDDEKFLQFNSAVGEAKNAIQDIKAATTFQASDTKLITGLSSALNGLVGGYSAAAAAAQMWAGDDENVQKKMMQLQQLLVLVNGLQSLANSLQTESGAIQLALAAKTSLLSAAKKIQNLITGEAVKIIAAEAEANVALAESQAAVAESSTAVVEGNAVVTDSAATATVALEAEAVAAGEAEVATTAFSTTLIATGIGAVIIAIGVAVAYLIVKIREWTASTQLTIKEQKELTDAIDSQVEALQKLNDLEDAVGKKGLDNLQHQLELEEKSGKNQYAIFAIKERIAEQNEKIADAKYARALAQAEDKYVKDGLIGVDALHKAQSDYLDDRVEKNTKVLVLEKDLANLQELTEKERKQRNVSDKDIEHAKERLDLAKSEAKLADDTYNFFLKAEDDKTKAHNDQENLRTERSKFSEDEERKLIMETAKLRSEVVKATNDRILSDEASTLQQRLAAIRSNAAEERKIAELTFKQSREQFSKGEITPAEFELAARQLEAKRKQVAIESGKQIEDVNRKYYERDRDAALASFKTQQEDKIKAAQELQAGKRNNPNPLVNPEPADLATRLKALSDEYSARRDMLNAELKVELDKEGQTAEEKRAIYEKYGSNILVLNKDLQKTYLELEKEAQDQSLRQWQLYYSKRKEQIDEEEADSIKSLNTKSISDKAYNRERQKIEDQAAVRKAQIEVQNAEVERNSTKEGTQARIDADGKLAKSALDLSDKIKKAKKDGENAEKERIEEGVQEAEMLGDAIVTALDISYNTQKVHLEELEMRQQRAYEQNVKNINDSSATEEQKAIRLKILDDQRQVQKEINDRKQRQLDIQKAQFDKANAIMHIILNTAVSVMKAADDVPLAIAIAIQGAAELAAAVATPLPKYAHGTEDHPGGKAVVGDAYERELILEPGKKARWSANVPTVEDLLPHTKVIPPEQINGWIRSGMMVNQEGVLVVQSDNKKELREIREAIIWQTQRMEAASNKNKGRVVIQNKIDVGWTNYLNEQVYHRK